MRSLCIRSRRRGPQGTLANPMGSLIKFAEKKYHAEKYMLGLV
jgi:hypothetical protein